MIWPISTFCLLYFLPCSIQDYWCCAACKNVNHPFQRFCGKCWNVRTDWLPAQQSLCDSKNPASEKIGSIIDVGTDDLLKSTATDSGLGSTQVSSQESTDLTVTKKVDASDGLSLNSFILPSLSDYSNHKSPVDIESQKLELRYACSNIQMKETGAKDLDDSTSNTLSTSQVTRSNMESKMLDDPCMICLSRPKTASLIHGTTGHQVCCFTCAKRLKRRRQDCPVCRRSIQKVIRNYIL